MFPTTSLKPQYDVRASFEARGGIFGGPGFSGLSQIPRNKSLCKLLLSIHGGKAAKIKIFLLIVHPHPQEGERSHILIPEAVWIFARGKCSAGTSPAPLSILRISKTPHYSREWDRKVTSPVLGWQQARPTLNPKKFIASHPRLLGIHEDWAQGERDGHRGFGFLVFL